MASAAQVPLSPFMSRRNHVVPDPTCLNYLLYFVFLLIFICFGFPFGLHVVDVSMFFVSLSRIWFRAQIDSKPHQKSSPTTMFFWMIKIIQFRNNWFFEGLAGGARERKNYQTNIENDTNIHSQIEEKTMQNLSSKKWCNKKYRRHQTWNPNGSK